MIKYNYDSSSDGENHQYSEASILERMKEHESKSSFILSEVAQSMLERKSLVEKYKGRKSELVFKQKQDNKYEIGIILAGNNETELLKLLHKKNGNLYDKLEGIKNQIPCDQWANFLDTQEISKISEFIYNNRCSNNNGKRKREVQKNKDIIKNISELIISKAQNLEQEINSELQKINSCFNIEDAKKTFLKLLGKISKEFLVREFALLLSYDNRQSKYTSYVNALSQEIKSLYKEEIENYCKESYEHNMTQILCDFRPKKIFAEDMDDFFINFKLDHRIIRSIIKTYGVDNNCTNTNKLHHDFKIKNNSAYIVHLSTHISKNGLRTDYVDINNIKNTTYLEISNELNSEIYKNYFMKYKIANLFKRIISGQDIVKVCDNDYGNKYIEKLYQIVFLLFWVEPERNVSAFLTNAMFFDLVEAEKYQITDMAEKMPMAMEGAVDASRSLLDELGGIYGSARDSSKHLVKRQYYDFKIGDKSKALELSKRNSQILEDWLGMKQSDDNKDQNTINDSVKNLNIHDDYNSYFKALHGLVKGWYNVDLTFLIDNN